MPRINLSWLLHRAAIVVVGTGMLFMTTFAHANCGRMSGAKPARSTTGRLPSTQSNGNGQGNRNGSIVGLWHVTYSSADGSTEFFQSFDQFHSDGNEFEGAALGPGALCQGTWKELAPGKVQLFHVGWNFDLSGQLIGYFTEVQVETLSADGKSYQGTFDVQNFDLQGNPDANLGTMSGGVSADRIVDSFSL